VHALHRTDHPLIDLALFKNSAVTLSNAAMFTFSVGFFGAVLVIPSYLQQLLHETPLQSGLQLIPQGLGAMLTMPLAGTLMDKRGPRNVLLVGIALIVAGLSVFAYGAWQQADYLPILMVGLVTTGIGLGCTLTPLSGAAVQTLAPNEVARGSTLLSVNQHVAVAVGTALMSVILTSQFHRSETIGTAEKLGILRGKFGKHGSAAPSHDPLLHHRANSVDCRCRGDASAGGVPAQQAAAGRSRPVDGSRLGRYSSNSIDDDPATLAHR
jgi:DHA2 family multidrug resistance protein